MKTLKIKSIDVQAKEWFDKVNGNSYFSAIITINNGLKDSLAINIPFQYGYETQFENEAQNTLNKTGYINASSLREMKDYCRENNISLMFSKKEGCTMKETKNFVN